MLTGAGDTPGADGPEKETDAGLARERAVLASLRRAGPAFFGRFGRLAAIQRTAIPEILAGRDAILCAPTAGGKTEAVAAPLAERHLAARPGGLALLLVCPTRALVNDLHRRLVAPLEALGIELGRKSSDHPAPAGEPLEPWVVTTPESFDSLLVRRPRDLVGVRAVVLDEIHLLDGTPRGDQLRLLMARLRRLHDAAVQRGDRPADAPLQTVLLSATLAEPETCAALYARDAVVVRAGRPRAIETAGTRLASPGSLLRAIAGLARGAAGSRSVSPAGDAAKLLIFCRSRGECEEVAAALVGRPPYGANVFAHHGSLSRRTRLAAEEAFHRASTAVFVATSTLELGVDIGDIDWVVQFGPPPSVESFLQQIGRGCRRRKDMTRVMAIARSAFDEVLFEVLLTEARAGRVTPRPRVFTASVAAQQLGSYLLQRSSGTVGLDEFGALFAPAGGGRATGVPTAPELAAIAGKLADGGLLVPARGGRYAAGPELERWAEKHPRKLHTNLATPRDTIAVHDAESHEHLGEIQRGALPASGTMSFGGRRGRLESSAGDRVYVRRSSKTDDSPSPSYRAPRMPMSLALAQAVREHLGIPSGVVPAILDNDGKLAVLPFLGGSGTRALAAHLAKRKLKVLAWTDVAIRLDTTAVVEHLRMDRGALENLSYAVWKDLERLQDAGAHVRYVPDECRRRQVVERLVVSGVLELTCGFTEIRYLVGDAARVLRPCI